MENKALVAQAVIDEGEQQTVIEIYDDASFTGFFTCWNVKDGKRTPILSRSRAIAMDIEDLAAQFSSHSEQYSKRKVLSVKVQVFDEAAYQTLLNAAPDTLGLAKLTSHDLDAMIPRKVPAWTEGHTPLQKRMDRLFKPKAR